MRGRYASLFGILILLAAAAREAGCQTPGDTVSLREFEVVASYPVNNIGFKKVRMDSALLIPNINADLSTLLSQYSTIFIKTYGNGSLATPSFRGTSAHHTQVEWNGISLNSPMLGQMDLATLPVSQFDGIEILYGGAGIFNSGGAFGGIINLLSNPDWNNRINVTLAQTFASFNTFTTNINAAAGTASFQALTKANYTSSQNDFKYFNNDLDSVMRQTNSSYRQYGLSEDLFFRFGQKHFLSVKLWYSRNYRDIPPVMTNPDPDHYENQEDESVRGLIEYKYLEKKYNITVKSALIDDYLRYRNDSLDAQHKYYSFVNRIRLNWVGSEIVTIKPGIDLISDWVVSDAYAETKQRQLAGLFGEMVIAPGHNVNMSLVAREDLVDGLLMPFIFAAGLQYRPLKDLNWSVSSNFSRNYRLPTLNDLYWSVYGNPELKPESSLTAEAGSVFNTFLADRHLFLELEVTGYYSWITDLIIWQPVEGNSLLWKPDNLNDVHARGLETGLNGKYQVAGWNLGINANYNFCRSTNEKGSGPDDEKVGKQLIYIPVNTLNTTLNVDWKDLYLSYNFIFTSRRYTGTDNLTYMPGYNLSNIFAGKNFHLKNFVLSLQLEINNLFDLDYQSIANRPMPGRNYAVTLRGNFRK